MTTRKVFRKAAELVDSGAVRYSCVALDIVDYRLFFGRAKLKERYEGICGDQQNKFIDISNYSIVRDFWYWLDYRAPELCEDDKKQLRVLLLLLAGEVLSDE